MKITGHNIFMMSENQKQSISFSETRTVSSRISTADSDLLKSLNEQAVSFERNSSFLESDFISSSHYGLKFDTKKIKNEEFLSSKEQTDESMNELSGNDLEQFITSTKEDLISRASYDAEVLRKRAELQILRVVKRLMGYDTSDIDSQLEALNLSSSKTADHYAVFENSTSFFATKWF